MKTNLPTLLLVSLLFLGNAVHGQERQLEKAEIAYQHYAYMNAAEIYLEVVKSGYRTPELLKKLGNTYYFNAQYHEAAKWYQALFALTKTFEPIYYLRYYQSLNSIGEEKKAAQWYTLFCKKAGLEKTPTYENKMLLVQENAGRYLIKNLHINTPGADFGAAVHHGSLFFASTRKRKKSLDLYKANIVHGAEHQPDSLGTLAKIKGKINTRLHESSASFSKDGKTMYFTRNNRTPKEIARNAPKKLKIYRAHWKNGKWKDLEDLSINSDLYSTAHPALSPDGKKLYFASDMPGTLGGTDIFVVAIDENGTLGTPVNLGEKINTIGRETFPFVSANHELYFSSNGHFGLGGLDIFYVKLTPETKSGFGEVLNVGTPINSSKDDLAFGISTATNKGFFSSNRGAGAVKIYGDLYAFVEKAPVRAVKTAFISGVVTAAETQLPLDSTQVSFLNKENNVLKTIFTDRQGRYRFKGKRFEEYSIRAAKKKYDVTDKFIAVTEQENEVNIALTRNLFLLKPGADLGKILHIPAVYFDYDKANIRTDAAVGIQKIIASLQKYPALKIEIHAYTDSRGSKRYNQKLSERRAKSTMEYILKRGITKERMTYQGYGESHLMNDCKDGVPCSPEEHQRNRRSAFIVAE